MNEKEQIRQTIATLKAQRAILGDAVVETALASLHERLATLEASAIHAIQDEQRQLVTILFADVSGFTALSEKLDAEDVQDMLRHLWPRLDQVILSHNGTIDKHLGDGVMAIWGLEQSREDDPLQAVRAALALQTELVAFRYERDTPLAMRVGLNTGLVSISHVLSTGERNIIGDTVNLAARLEKIAPADGVLISQSTYDRVRGLFDVYIQPPLQVKGKTQPVHTYLVQREKPHTFSMPTRGLAGVVTRTIGRQAELIRLQTTYQHTLNEGTVHWITISGEAGVGKSRLLLEFNHWVELRSEEIAYLKGRAWPHTQSTPYFVLRDLLSSHFRISDSDSLTVAREKLVDGLSQILGDKLGEESAAFIGQLIGVDFRQSRWISRIIQDPRQIRGRAEVLLDQYLARLCAASPTILLLEDLHWADEESLLLLSRILSRPELGPLCAIGLARPEFWDRGILWGHDTKAIPLAHHHHVELSPLPDSLAEELARELLQKLDQPPDWLIALLVERGAGNPYFIEELVHWLIEQNVIEVDAGVWLVNEDQSLALSVPSSVQGVLQARLERLSDTERAILQRAAVIGRVFWEGAVNYIGQQAVLPAHWKALQRRDLIFWQPMSQLPQEQEYQFKHVLLRDVVYEYTLKKLRQVYHRRAAEWLTQVAAERVNEWAAVIAEHYEKAHDQTTAAEWYGRAGDYAQVTYAPEAAIHYYRKALKLLPPERLQDCASQCLNWHAGLGKMLRSQARYPEAVQAYKSMLSIAEQAGDIASQASAWIGLSDVQDSQGDCRDALESAQQAHEIAQAADLQLELAQALFWQGWAFLRLGEGKSARELGEQALALSTQLQAQYVMALSLNLLGNTHNYLLGNYERANHYLKRALALFQELGNRPRIAWTLNSLGEIARKCGDYDMAIPFYLDALTIVREIGDRHTEMTLLSNLGGAQVGLGEHQVAQANLLQVIAEATVANPPFLTETYHFLARVYLAQNQTEEALAAAQKSLALGQETGIPEIIGEAWRVAGTVVSQLVQPIAIGDQSYDAAACFAESARILAGIGTQGEYARTLREWARYEREQGNTAQADRMWQQAQGIFARLKLTLELERMTRLDER